PGKRDGVMQLTTDVNRLKDFLFARLGSPVGSPGSVTLFDATESQHELFSDHICRSEYPEAVTARGLTKNMWQPRPDGGVDNDWLDCLVGCMALASRAGACLQMNGGAQPVRKGNGSRISSRWKR